MDCKWRQSGLWEREGNQLSSLPDGIEPAYLSVTYNLQSCTVSHRIGMWYGWRMCYKQCPVSHVFSSTCYYEFQQVGVRRYLGTVLLAPPGARWAFTVVPLLC